MNQNPDASLNRFNYRNLAEVITKSTITEGSNALFVGMVPHYLHTLLYATLVSHSLLTLSRPFTPPTPT